MFTVLDGQIEVTFRGETKVVGAGQTVDVPANAPHFFRNNSERPAHLLCMCPPAGQEEYFMAVGDAVPSASTPPPQLSEAEQAQRQTKAQSLATRYRTELVR
ncbi:cupin domain-containing protein [Micromonospora phytophila]|uniref:cupin domain-containing protein n=1 Tax=Micromonospora phytophila TaxID=709888 RepID=UPI0020304250|nr:cupin domain-containing protein [Micromonospora phytophila]MCM0675252.1 cupin domain-containing protein [Micromonospora phytophila]